MARVQAEMVKIMDGAEPLVVDSAQAGGPLPPPALPAPTYPPAPVVSMGGGAANVGMFADIRLQVLTGCLWGMMSAPGPDTPAELSARFRDLLQDVAAKTKKQVSGATQWP